MTASKWTPETRGALLERTAAGVSLRDACRALGLREMTVKGWLTRGRREGSGPYAEFAQAVGEARKSARERPEPMTAEEFRRHLDKSVRAGSVQGMKLWAERFLATEEPDEPENLTWLREHRRAK